MLNIFKNAYLKSRLLQALKYLPARQSELAQLLTAGLHVFQMMPLLYVDLVTCYAETTNFFQLCNFSCYVVTV